MGIFNKNKVREGLYRDNGYMIGCDSHVIYHVPENPHQNIFIFPEGTRGLAETAIIEMRKYKAKFIIVPASFKKFNVELLNFDNLEMIQLNEGIEEVKCFFGQRQTAVDIVLPKTIKRIGSNNYPVVQDLVLSDGVVEIEKFFASHDTNLISANMPGTIKEIPEGTFNQCKNLQTVILNEGIETSMPNAFLGTNNLCTLELPSTFNGTLNLFMDPRPLSNVRGNSRYDGRRFEEEKNQILSIKIKRGNKNFEFNIKRGEQPKIEIKQDIIKIKCVSQSQYISIDCAQLEPGRYDIENGTIKIHQSLSLQEQLVNQNVHDQDAMDKLDITFQNAYRDNITKRDDFVGLSSTMKMQIKRAMRTLFFQIAGQFGTVNTDYEMFDYLYNRVLKETQFEDTLPDHQSGFGSTGMKR